MAALLILRTLHTVRRTRPLLAWLAGLFLLFSGLVVTAALTERGLTKHTPQTLTVRSNASLPAEVKSLEAQTAYYLTDRDTTTEFTAFAQNEVELAFESARTLDEVRVYGPAPYLMTVQSGNAGNWQTVPGLADIDLSKQKTDWNAFSASTPVTAQQLRLVLTPQAGGGAGIKEIEFWGEGHPFNVPDGTRLMAALETDSPPAHVREYSAKPVSDTVGHGRPKAFRITLDRDPATFKRAYLVYEVYGLAHWVSAPRSINGHPMRGGEFRFTDREFTSQAEAIHPRWLLAGDNTVTFSVPEHVPGTYTVRHVRLVAELETGSNFVSAVSGTPDADTNAVAWLIDGKIDRGWRPWANDSTAQNAKPEAVFAFDKPTKVDGLSLYLVNHMEGTVSVAFKQGGAWKGAARSLNARKWVTGWNGINVTSNTPVDAIRLTFENGQASTGELRELLPVGSGVGSAFASRVSVTYPDNGQFFGRQAYIRGFLDRPDNGSGPAQLFIGGQQIDSPDGAFGVLISKDEVGLADQADADPWSVTLDAVYPDSERISTTVVLDNPGNARHVLGALPASSPNQGGGGRHLKVEGAELDADADAIDDDLQIKITPLKASELPPLDPGMTNVTKGPHAGYRFTPSPYKFKKHIKVTLPYDKTKVPNGLRDNDIKTYYYDIEVGHWIALDRDALNQQKETVTSLTDHFTDMINATVTVPDHPQAVNFNPTQIKDIKAADPGAGINLIEPPKANNMGDARLNYPIEIPAGRGGMQPQLAISYSSGGGNGWLGLGWDLSVPSISIDTRWGVPRYGYKNGSYANLETETYTLGGQQLTPVAHRGALKSRDEDTTVIDGETVKVFHTRVEGGFQKIIRHGTGPTDYWWEVIDKNGTRNFYGGFNVEDTNGKLGSSRGVFKWMLRKTIDTNGNEVTYSYEQVSNAGVATGVAGTQLYLSEINYTGHNGTVGAYHVSFTRETGRADIQIDARGGFKQVTADRLKRIEVKFQNDMVRHYELHYIEGAFKKTLLERISQHGADGSLFNEHKFAYYDDIRNPDKTYKGFLAAQDVDTGTDNLTEFHNFKYTVLGGSVGQTGGFDGYGGVGVGGTKMINVGVGINAARSTAKGTGTFVDINGDGLPDKVYKTSGGTKYRLSKTEPGSLTAVTYDTSREGAKSLPGFTRPSDTESLSGNLSVQAFVVGLTGNGGIGFTSTNDKTYLSDVNGDGLVDIVNSGAVLFNAADGTVNKFSSNSYDTRVPIGNIGGSVDQSVMPVLDNEKAQFEKDNPLMDNVRRWVAPFNGHVRISGAVQLVNFDSDAFPQEIRDERKEHRTADGVFVSIQKNGTRLWSMPIGPENYDPHNPVNVGNVKVNKDDVIYFRVQSVFDGVYDRVNWSPRVEYTKSGNGTPLSYLDVNNLVAYKFAANDDFVLANRQLEMTAPYRGVLKFRGLLNKTKVTTDDVTLRVTRIERVLNEDTGEITSETKSVVLEKTLPWDYTGQIDLAADPEIQTITVNRFNGINVEFAIDSQIDLTAVKWGDLRSSSSPRPGMPELYYTEAWSENETPLAPTEEPDYTSTPPTNAEDVRPKKSDKNDMSPITGEDGQEIVIEDVPLETEDPVTHEAKIVMPVKFDADIYAKNHLTSPQQPTWVAPEDGMILMTPWATPVIHFGTDENDNPYRYTDIPDGSVAITVKRRGELVAKQNIKIRNGHMVDGSQGYNALKLFRVSRGDELFFDASTRDKKIEQELATAQVRFHYASKTAWKVPLTDAIDFQAYIGGHSPDDPDPANYTFGQAPTYDRRAMLVIRRGEEEIVHKEILTFQSGFEQLYREYAQNVNEGEQWYFDVFTAESSLSLSPTQVWSLYQAPNSWTVPFNGTAGVTPVLNFKQGTVPDGSFTLSVMRNNSAVASRAYQVKNGKVITDPENPLPVTVSAGEALEFSFRTTSHAMSSYLADKGSVRIDYIDREYWTVPDEYPDNSVAVTPELKLTQGGTIGDGAVVFRVLRGKTELAVREYTVTDGSIVEQYTSPITVPVAPNQKISFVYETEQLAIAKAMQSSRVKAIIDGTSTNVPFVINLLNQVVGSRTLYIGMPLKNAHQPAMGAVHHSRLDDPLWGNPYRGWGTAAYNGNDHIEDNGNDPTAELIEPGRFQLSSNKNDYKNSNKQHKAWMAYGVIEQDRWFSEDSLWWTSADGVSASRRGRDSFYIPTAEEFVAATSGSEDEDPNPKGYSGAARPPKMSQTNLQSYGFGFVFTKGFTDNVTTSLIDVMDMNGDRFPDVLGTGATNYTWADGTLFDVAGGAGNPRQSTARGTSLGLGPSGPGSTADAEGRTPTDGDKYLAVLAAIPVSLGVSEGVNEVDYDLIDINGDGLPDRVTKAGGGLSVQLNNGYGFVPGADTWNTGTISQGENRGKNFSVGFGMWNTNFGGGVSLSESHNFNNIGLMDINGDGLPDAVQGTNSGNFNVWFNTGAGFVGRNAQNDPYIWPGALRAYKDLKGGRTGGTIGRTPLSDGGSSSAGISLKYSFGVTIFGFNVSFSFGGNTGQTVQQPSIAYMDVNGDGFVDGIRSARDNEMTVAINPIQRTNMLRSVTRPMGSTIDVDYKRVGNTFEMPQSRYVMSSVTVFDGVADGFSGDGTAGKGSDYQHTRFNYQGGYQSRYERDFYGFKTVTETQYDTTGKAWGDLANMGDGDRYRQVTSEYLNRSYYTKGKVKEQRTDAFTSQGGLAPYLKIENTYEVRQVQTYGDDKPAARFPALTETTKSFYEGGTGEKSTTTTMDYDAFGNVTSFTDEGEPSTTDDDVVAAIGYTSDDPASLSCAALHIIGKASSIKVRVKGELVRHRTATFFCENGTGNLKTVEQHIAYKPDSAGIESLMARYGLGQTATTTMVYNDYGNITDLTGPANRQGKSIHLIYTYDGLVNTYPVKIRNESYKIESEAKYEYLFGKPEWTKDLNDNYIRYEYDTFGRTKAVKGPYENGQATITFDYYPVVALAARSEPTTSVPNPAPGVVDPSWAKTFHYDRDWQNKPKGTIDTVLFTDGLKRVLQTKKDASIGGQNDQSMIVSGRVVFDGLGRTVAQYYPSRETKSDTPKGNGNFTDTPDAVEPTVMRYDVLGRNTYTRIPDGSETAVVYDIANGLFKKTTTDACSNTRISHRNIRDLITRVDEFISETPSTDGAGKCQNTGQGRMLTTTYEYDGLKQIRKVTDDAGNVTTVDYDDFGRRTVITNPDTGRVETAYDLAGNAVAKLTPNLTGSNGTASTPIEYDYDATRLVGIRYPLHPENNVTYTYGEDTDAARLLNQVGRVVTVTHGGGSKTMEYGKLGETVAEHSTITIRPPDKTYTTRYHFDTFGRLLHMTFPDGERLVHEYDSGGNIAHIEGYKRGGERRVYLDEMRYDKFEQRTYMRLGNGVETNYAYKTKNRRLAKLSSHLPTGGQGRGGRADGRQFQNLEYTYDRVGNITVLANNIDVPANKDLGGPTQQHFTYDSLYRLIGAQGTYTTAKAQHTYGLTMRYDNIHNIVFKDQKHDVIGSNGVAKAQRGTTYAWDYQYQGAQPHAPTHIGGRTYTYDANGNQTGYTVDGKNTHRIITWDEENRISSIQDQGKTSVYTYDDQGQRLTKRTDQGEVAYVNQFYTVRNGAIPTKHVYAGTTRILSKRLGGGNPTTAPDNWNKPGRGGGPNLNGPNSTGTKTSHDKGNGKPVTAMATTDAGTFPGQGIAHRSDRANEVAQNTYRNPNLNGGFPGGDKSQGNHGNSGNDGNGGNNGHGSGNGGSNGNGGTGGSGGNSTWKPEEEFVYYYHPDHLGSTGYVTDEDGLLYEHVEYFPFGETWVQEANNTERTPYLYTSKELDEETGLYYYGARYYDPRTSVWQSADPILAKYLPTGNQEQNGKLPGMGGIYNSMNLGMYSYSHQNPLKYTDPDGRWPSDKVHFLKTKKWAMDVGLSSSQAQTVGEGSAWIDSWFSGKSYMPFIGNQGYHFDTNPGGVDSRILAHRKEYRSAVKWGRWAKSWRTSRGGIIGWFKNLVAGILESVSLHKLGRSLHPIQDMDAHTPEYTKYDKEGKYYYHDQPFFGTDDKADDHLGNFPDSHGPERLKITEKKTKDIIRRYIKDVNK